MFEMGPLATQWSMAFQEVADYMYLSPSRQAVDAHVFCVNKNKWEELPDDLKLVVKRVIEANAVQSYTELLKLDDVALQSFIDYGTIVGPLPEAVEEEWAKVVKEFYDSKATEHGGLYAEVVEAIRESKAFFERHGVS